MCVCVSLPYQLRHSCRLTMEKVIWGVGGDGTLPVLFSLCSSTPERFKRDCPRCKIDYPVGNKYAECNKRQQEACRPTSRFGEEKVPKWSFFGCQLFVQQFSNTPTYHVFPCHSSRLKTRSREETGSAVPYRVSLLILHVQAEYGAYSRVPLFSTAFLVGVF